MSEIGRRRALAWIGLGLPAVLACRGSKGPAGALPLTATVTIAPVADRDPWVMALLTELSQHPVAGVEALLADRNGNAGDRRPDPTLRGDDRETLAAALAAYEAAHQRPTSLRPIWEREPARDRPQETWRLYFDEPARGFVLDGEARAALVDEPDWKLVHLYLGPAQREALRALTEANLGDRLALTIGDEALMVPTVMEPIAGGELAISPSPAGDVSAASEVLFQRLVGG